MCKICQPARAIIPSLFSVLRFPHCNSRCLQLIPTQASIASFLFAMVTLLCLGCRFALASEGSTTAPVTIGVDAPHQASIGGGIGETAYSSYYSFKTNEAGGYAIRLTNTHSNIGFHLFSSQFATLIDDNGCETSSTTTNGDKTCVYDLAANTNYSLSTTDWSYVSDTYTITVQNIKSEGGPGAPLPIIDGTSHAGMVDAASSSYYYFTPTSSGAYTLAITNTNYSGFPLHNSTSLQIDGYASNDFNTGLLRTCSPSYGAVYCTVNGLTQGVPVYIKISEENTAPGSDTIFTVTPNKGVGEGSVKQPIALSVGTPHAGAVDAGSNAYYQGCTNPSYSYYSFNTATGAGGYTATMDNTPLLKVHLFHSLNDTPLASCDPTSQLTPCMFSNIDPNSTYYLRVTNCNEAVVNYNILVKKEGSEGSINNPVPLTLEKSHAGSIGYYETSYFTFTTDKSGTYSIILDQPLQWSYTSSQDFTGSGNAYGSTTANLDGNKTYYLRVSNVGGTASIKQYTLKVSHGASEGSIADPVNLTVGSTHNARVASSGNSYYTFTTRAAADYFVKFDNPTELWVSAYTSPDFSNGTITTACPGVGPYLSCTLENLAPDTPYYIQAHEWANVDAAFKINIYTLDALVGCSAGSECYNFENGLTAPFTLTSTVSKGNTAKALWAIDTTNNAATGGTKSLKSGTLVYDQFNPQSSCLEYTRPTTAYSVLFSTKVAAPSSNTIEFSIDGTVQPGGTLYNWPQWKRLIFFPTPGQHTYKWCFKEDYPYVTTPDSAWLDDIEFTANPLVQVEGLGSSFGTIQDAYAAVAASSMSNAVLRAQAVTFDGPFTFENPINITLKGGVDPTFTSVTGTTYLSGILTVRSGRLTVDHVKIRY